MNKEMCAYLIKFNKILYFTTYLFVILRFQYIKGHESICSEDRSSPKQQFDVLGSPKSRNIRFMSLYIEYKIYLQKIIWTILKLCTKRF